MFWWHKLCGYTFPETLTRKTWGLCQFKMSENHGLMKTLFVNDYNKWHVHPCNSSFYFWLYESQHQTNMTKVHSDKKKKSASLDSKHFLNNQKLEVIGQGGGWGGEVRGGDGNLFFCLHIVQPWLHCIAAFFGFLVLKF